MAILAQLFISQVRVFIVSVRFRKLWRREWKVKRHFKSLPKSHWRDSFEDWKKNKISNKNSNASSYLIILSPNPHISYLLDPLSSVFCHYWMKSSLNSHYSVTLLNEELFKFKLYIGGGLKHCTWRRPYELWSYYISDVGVSICLKYFHYFDYKFEGQKQRTSMMAGLRVTTSLTDFLLFYF